MNSATPLQPAISSRNLPIFPSSHLPIHSSTHPPQHSHPLVSVRPPRSSVVVATVALRAWSALERARRNVSDRGARGQNLPAFGLWRLALLLLSGTLNFKLNLRGRNLPIRSGVKGQSRPIRHPPPSPTPTLPGLILVSDVIQSLRSFAPRPARADEYQIHFPHETSTALLLF